MIKINLRSVFVLAAGMILSTSLIAQQQGRSSFAADKYVISANAGGVNMTEGEVTVAKSGGRSGLLLKNDKLEIDDKVTTGANGRLEVLLNPGSYLRLGPNSSFAFVTTTLDDLQIRLERGSAMFEVFATNEFSVSVLTPRGSAVLVDSGVYRVDVRDDGSGTIAVFDGKAEVRAMSATTVKKGRTAVIDSADPLIAKFDRKKGEQNALAAWSKTRAKDLAKMTSSLRNDSVRDSLASSFHNGRWGMFDSFGLWVYSPFARAYCFLPFGYGWHSPYGYGFGHGIYWYRLPRVIRTPRSPVPPTYPSTATADGSAAARARRVAPPYTRVQPERAPVRSVPDWDLPSDTMPVRRVRPTGRPAPVKPIQIRPASRAN